MNTSVIDVRENQQIADELREAATLLEVQEQIHFGPAHIAKRRIRSLAWRGRFARPSMPRVSRGSTHCLISARASPRRSPKSSLPAAGTNSNACAGRWTR